MCLFIQTIFTLPRFHTYGDNKQQQQRLLDARVHLANAAAQQQQHLSS